MADNHGGCGPVPSWPTGGRCRSWHGTLTRAVRHSVARCWSLRSRRGRTVCWTCQSTEIGIIIIDAVSADDVTGQRKRLAALVQVRR
jgi:hypothetical protein